MVDQPDEAEDLVQEAFLRAYLSLASYDATYRFSTWLFRIATNLALNQIKAAKRVVSLEDLRREADAPPVVLVRFIPLMMGIGENSSANLWPSTSNRRRIIMEIGRRQRFMRIGFAIVTVLIRL